MLHSICQKIWKIQQWPQDWKRSVIIPVPKKKAMPKNAQNTTKLHSSHSFKMDCLDLLGVQGTLKSLLQHHSSKASILRHSAFFIVQLSHAYMTTGKTKALTRQT